MHFERLLETLTQNSFLSAMKSSAEETELKHWLVVMKKSAPILKHTHTHTHTTVSGQPIGVFPNFLKYMRCTWSTKILFSKLYLKTPGLKIHGFCSSDLNTESHDSSHRNTEILTELDECVFIPVLNAAWILVHSKNMTPTTRARKIITPIWRNNLRLI